MPRFFSSSCGRESFRATPEPSKSPPAEADANTSATPSSTSRWGRRPRLRRQCAHEFDVPEVSMPNTTTPRISQHEVKPANQELQSCENGSGYTEAPSSRAASETMSTQTAPSPCAVDLTDILSDVSGDDIFGADDELPDAVDPDVQQLSDAVSRVDISSASGNAQRKKYAYPLELRVEDFECGECIGKGSYSRVLLGAHVVSGTEWALKVVSKRKTIETKENLAHLYEEKNIASKAQGSDFLVRTAGTFQNQKSVVFAMEYLPGGDLYQRLADKRTVPLSEAVAWVAQAVLAIEDLHSLNIVHRDIKPENFLMGKSGTLKLTDFGFARELAPGERLFSQFGTPEYVAPEVLSGFGHGCPVDLWALGVLTYELLVGRTPFKAASVNDMYERIATANYAFPAPPARRRSSVTSKVSSRYPRNKRETDESGAYHETPQVRRHNYDAPADHVSAKSFSSTKSYNAPSLASAAAAVKFHSIRNTSSSSKEGKAASFYDSSISSKSSTGFAHSSLAPSPIRTARKGAATGQQSNHCRAHQGDEVVSSIQGGIEMSKREAGKLQRASKSRGKGDDNSRSFQVEDLPEEDGAQDPAAQSFVKSLLQLNPSRRPSIDEIKRHPFFEGVDFVALRAAVRAQAEIEEEEAIIKAAVDGGDVWLRGQPVKCISQDFDDHYAGAFKRF